MLPRWVQVLFALLAEAWSARRDAQLQFLKLQIQLLRQKLSDNRVILSPEDRLRLLKAGSALGHAVDDVLEIVSVKTCRRWIRQQRAGTMPGRVGRPKRMTRWLRKLILRLARENPGWGVRRIVGELRKLAITPGRSSVRRVLVHEGVLPDPQRHAPRSVVTPWCSFIAMHMNSLVACDFFCKMIWTPLGKQLAYALAFIHVSSRKVFVSPSTFHPTGDWMRQQARNVSMWAQEQHLQLRFLIHDRDTMFTAAFDEPFRQSDGTTGVVKMPFRAPIANAFAESWIGQFKRECLNHFMCLSLQYLDHIVQTFVSYHNTVRRHQGLGNVPPFRYGQMPPTGIDPPQGRVGSRVDRANKSLDGLMQYLLPRRETMEDVGIKSLCLQIGTGATEPGCKSASRRLKGPSMRWTGSNAEAMLGLESLHQSNLWSTYWQSRSKTAA